LPFRRARRQKPTKAKVQAKESQGRRPKKPTKAKVQAKESQGGARPEAKESH
jgi:hypothetical protein